MHVPRWRAVISILLAAVMTIAWIGPAGAVPGKSVGDEVTLQILAVNDFHGQLSPYSATLGGVAQLAGYLEMREAEAKLANTETWRLGVGDLIGASPANSGLLQDEPTLEALDEMGFMYSTVGNHEFDEGIQELLRLQYGGFHELTGHWERTHLQYLAANVVYEGTDETVFPPYVIEYVKGVPVGIIGVVYENTPTIVTASGVAGLEFLDEAESVNTCVAELQAKGVETIIVLEHNGGSGTTAGGAVTGDIVSVVSAMDDEVDVVLTAHSHARYWGYIDGKLVTQAHSAGRAFADIDLVIDRATGDVVSKSAQIVATTRGAGVAEDERVAAIVARADEFVAPIVNTVVGTAATEMTRAQNTAGESELGDLVADAQRWKMGTHIAAINPGGIRADLGAGEVTWGELFAIQPFSNYLVTMEMTGAQIDTMLEQQWQPGKPIYMLQLSGITYSWSASAPMGSRVDAAGVQVNGAPLDLTATYTVTANAFLADGGDNFVVFRDATNKVVHGVDLDALVEYVGQLPQPFDQVVDGRFTVLP